MINTHHIILHNHQNLNKHNFKVIYFFCDLQYYITVESRLTVTRGTGGSTDNRKDTVKGEKMRIFFSFFNVHTQ